MLKWHFNVRDDGIIEVDFGPEWAGFTEALNDSVTTRAARGQTPGLSTYWIDRTLDALQAASGPRTVIASGPANLFSTRAKSSPARNMKSGMTSVWTPTNSKPDCALGARRQSNASGDIPELNVTVRVWRLVRV